MSECSLTAHKLVLGPPCVAKRCTLTALSTGSNLQERQLGPGIKLGSYLCWCLAWVATRCTASLSRSFAVAALGPVLITMTCCPRSAAKSLSASSACRDQRGKMPQIKIDGAAPASEHK